MERSHLAHFVCNSETWVSGGGTEFGLCEDRLDRKSPWNLMPMDVADIAWWFHWGAAECLSGQTGTGLFRLTAACWAHGATLNRAAAGHLRHPSFLQPGRKTQIHFKHTRPCPRGRATFLLTAATLEWITKPIWVAQKGACWRLLPKWWRLFAFKCMCVVDSISRYEARLTVVIVMLSPVLVDPNYSHAFKIHCSSKQALPDLFFSLMKPCLHPTHTLLSSSIQ